LVTLDKGDIAEKAVAETAVLPVVKSCLTQGRVDGTGGRGSFSGLKDALDMIFNEVKKSLYVPLLEAENLFHAAADAEAVTFPIDLLVSGVWATVTNYISDKYSGVFSIGIADRFLNAYNAIESFTARLSNIFGEDSLPCHAIKGRLGRHPQVLQFHSRWRLDLYYQVRLLQQHGFYLLIIIYPN
jgi:hypothetical protein